MRTKLCVLMAMAGVVALVPPSPARARAEAVASLRRVTIVRADEPGAMTVSLPTAIDPFAPKRGPGGGLPFTGTGSGRITAFVLTRETNDAPPGSGATLYGWSVGHCTTRGCHRPNHGFFVTYVFSKNLETMGSKQVLPAGRYRLYFVPDGRDASFTLTFEELSGRTTLVPREPVDAELPPLKGRAPEEAEQWTSWAGTTASLEGAGLFIVDTWIDRSSRQQQAGVVGLCIYATGQQLPEDVAYGPGCPTGTHPVEPTVAKQSEVAYAGTFENLPRGGGAWYAEPFGQASVGSVALWLKF